MKIEEKGGAGRMRWRVDKVGVWAVGVDVCVAEGDDKIALVPEVVDPGITDAVGDPRADRGVEANKRLDRVVVVSVSIDVEGRSESRASSSGVDTRVTRPERGCGETTFVVLDLGNSNSNPGVRGKWLRVRYRWRIP
jgi:hypothetical protein